MSETKNSQPMHAHLYPVVQPAYVNQTHPPITPICAVPVIPQPNQYVTPLDPVFVDHISRHRGQRIAVMTTAGLMEGVLTGIAVDHIQLNLSETRAVHIRIAQIVYFEGLPISYE